MLGFFFLDFLDFLGSGDCVLSVEEAPSLDEEEFCSDSSFCVDSLVAAAWRAISSHVALSSVEGAGVEDGKVASSTALEGGDCFASSAAASLATFLADSLLAPAL